MAVNYRNRETGSVATFSQPQPRLARDDRWELVPDEAAAPAHSATKAEWVAYAESQGIDVEGLTRDEIIDAVGV